MLPEIVLYAAVPSAMPTRIQSRARRRQPHLVFVALALVEAQADDGVAGDRGRLELDQRETALAHFDLRFARAGGEDLVVVELLDFPPRAIRRIDAEGRDACRRAPACRTCRTCAARSPGACGHRRPASKRPCRSRRAPGRRRSAPMRSALPDHLAVRRRGCARRACCRRRRDRRRASGSAPPCWRR